MKAALWYKSGDIRIEDIPEPSPCAGEVKIKVKWCGTCGSDLHEFTMGPIFIPVENPHPITQEVAPVIMGHEFSGEITEVGEGVTNLAVGDRVTVEPLIVCGEYCRLYVLFLSLPHSRAAARTLIRRISVRHWKKLSTQISTTVAQGSFCRSCSPTQACQMGVFRAFSAVWTTLMAA